MKANTVPPQCQIITIPQYHSNRVPQYHSNKVTPYHSTTVTEYLKTWAIRMRTFTIAQSYNASFLSKPWVIILITRLSSSSFLLKPYRHSITLMYQIIFVNDRQEHNTDFEIKFSAICNRGTVLFSQNSIQTFAGCFSPHQISVQIFNWENVNTKKRRRTKKENVERILFLSWLNKKRFQRRPRRDEGSWN